MSEEKLRSELYDSFKNRAILYYLIFDEMQKEIGPEKAEEILARAVYRRGAQTGEAKLARFGPDDLSGLQEAFLEGIPDNGQMFGPEVIRSDAEGVDIKFHGCPLRDAWQELGLPEDEVARICRIAARVDNGLFEAAGFAFSADTWKPGGDGCCYLHIRPGSKE